MKPQNWLQDHALTDEEWALVRAHREGGREGVLRALGMEQVGWGTRWPDGVWYMQPPNLRDDSAVPVFARVALPEPSEGEK